LLGDAVLRRGTEADRCVGLRFKRIGDLFLFDLAPLFDSDDEIVARRDGEHGKPETKHIEEDPLRGRLSC
jgi:hypothetical protein